MCKDMDLDPYFIQIMSVSMSISRAYYIRLHHMPIRSYNLYYYVPLRQPAYCINTAIGSNIKGILIHRLLS